MKIALCLACVVLAVGCGKSTSPREAERPATSPSEAEQLSCSREKVEELVRDFLDAFNAGDLTKLDRLVASEPEFRWYSVDAPGEGLERDSYDRGTLMSYFARRHQRGERLELRSFQFNGHSAGYGHFEYGLVRSAGDLPPTDYYGKGAAICQQTKSVIAVWSMGREQT